MSKRFTKVGSGAVENGGAHCSRYVGELFVAGLADLKTPVREPPPRYLPRERPLPVRHGYDASAHAHDSSCARDILVVTSGRTVNAGSPRLPAAARRRARTAIARWCLWLRERVLVFQCSHMVSAPLLNQ
jgi:hypothetical protein